MRKFALVFLGAASVLPEFSNDKSTDYNFIGNCPGTDERIDDPGYAISAD